MSDLTAIDILIEPDDDALQHARKWNARLREGVPDGFALDATHQPHVTMLQRYVRTAQLDDFFDAVGKAVAGIDVATLSLQAVAIAHANWGTPGQEPAALMLQPNPQVLDLQAAVLAAATPFVQADGTGAAYLLDPGEKIDQNTLEFVKNYVPNQIGAGGDFTALGAGGKPAPGAKGYTPHITVGVGRTDDLKAIDDEPFETFAVHPAGVAVYHLGRYGTARKQLKKWTLAKK
ncbi:hypothetical protein [Streptomyces canus]|uniref:hypothetical protein n=1 Tax=Streptomyces canus TaxID=58343 RepID=UPI002E2C222F|nr:hypothetical protein [Streptomyces canus]